MKTQFNITTSACDLDRFSDRAAFLELLDGFDGVELMCFEEDFRGIIPREKVVGLHLVCPNYWLDFWNEDMTACLQEYETMENVRACYGGDTRAALLDRFRGDLENAKRYGAEYVVFHVSDCTTTEAITGKFRHTDAEVIDASCELLNALFPADWDDGPALLMENLWEPGLRFTDPEMTARLLEGVHYSNKGLMLDTGHLMHTNPSLRTQKESLDYIHRMLDMHEPFIRHIRGIHLNQSLTGPLIRRTMKDPPVLSNRYFERFGQTFEYIFKVDKHRPFTCEGVRGLIERVSPEYLTFEFISNDLREHTRMLRQQQRALAKESEK